MIQFTGLRFLNSNIASMQTFVGIRKICVNSCLQLNQSRAEELAERKRQDQEMNWTKLYQFNDMKYHAIVTRMKIYPFFTTVIVTPLIVLAQSIGEFSNITATPFLLTGLVGTTILGAYSKALANTIGIISICKQNKMLKIAYIDFFGSQIIIETTVDEVRKWKKSKLKLNLYKTVNAINGKEKIILKIPWKNTDIYDIKLFRRLFGK